VCQSCRARDATPALTDHAAALLPVPIPASHPSFVAAQDTAGFLGSKCTLLTPVQIFCPTELPRSSLQGWSEGVLLPVCTLVWDCPNPSATPCTWPFTTSLVLHRPTFQTCPCLSGWYPSFCCTDCTNQLGAISKLAAGTLNPTIYVLDKYVEEHLSQDRPLGDTICHQPPPACRAIDNSSLAVTIQPTLCPPNSPSFQSIFLQFKDKDVVQDHRVIKSLKLERPLRSPHHQHNLIKSRHFVQNLLFPQKSPGMVTTLLPWAACFSTSLPFLRRNFSLHPT